MIDINFGFGRFYDDGHEPAIAINKKNVILELHSSERELKLYYKLGIIDRTEILWRSSGGTYIEWGAQPSCALMSNGTVIQVHRNQVLPWLYYRLGEVRLNEIRWNDAERYTYGKDPSVAINDHGVVVEVHAAEAFEGLWCRVGFVSGGNISWGSDEPYDEGHRPRVAINDNQDVVAVHRANSGSNHIYYRVGKINLVKKIVEWGPSTLLYTGAVQCAVALNNSGDVFLTYRQSFGVNLLWSQTGELDSFGKKINLNRGRPRYYDDGVTPSIACNDRVAVTTHQSEAERTLWANSSLIVDRANWMSDNLENIKDKTLRDIAIPGSHQAAIYVAANPWVIGTIGAPGPGVCQNLTIKNQLECGVRYFDLRPGRTRGRFAFTHYGAINYHGEWLDEVLDDVNDFMLNHRECIILKFSHFGDFFDDALYRDWMTVVTSKLGRFLFRTTDASINLAKVKLGEFMNQQGAGSVLVIVKESKFTDNPINQFTGVFTGRDQDSPVVANLSIYDSYLEDPRYVKMRDDQFEKFRKFGIVDVESEKEKIPDLFLLCWTCTPKAGKVPLTTVWWIAREPDAYLGRDMFELKNPNAQGRQINIIQTDFSEHARVTDVCLFMNGLASIAPLFPVPLKALGGAREMPASPWLSTAHEQRSASVQANSTVCEQHSTTEASLLVNSTVYESQGSDLDNSLPSSSSHEYQSASALGMLCSTPWGSKR